MLLWTDGWFESDATLPEVPDTAIFGWYNYEATDTISSGVAAGAYKSDNQAMLFNVVVNN